MRSENYGRPTVLCRVRTSQLHEVQTISGRAATIVECRRFDEFCCGMDPLHKLNYTQVERCVLL